jgi:hypothetical protein
MPAKAGIQGHQQASQPWIPAFAGMTEKSKRSYLANAITLSGGSSGPVEVTTEDYH